MTDKQTITGLVITGTLLVLLIIVTLFLEGNNRDILLNEGGIVESASVIGYFLCAAFILYKGSLAYLIRFHYLFLLIIFFMLRELDFHKRFTTMGIFKSQFFISNNVPFVEKFIGTLVILLLLYLIFSILYFNLKDFYYGLRNRSTVSLGALIVAILLVASKFLDGIARKLNEVGIEVGGRASMHASAMEEILELGIPIVLLLTFNAYFKQIIKPDNAIPTEANSTVPQSRK